jgi:hypothetical protein
MPCGGHGILDGLLMFLRNEQDDKIRNDGFFLQEKISYKRDGKNGNEDISQQADNGTENVGDH